MTELLSTVKLASRLGISRHALRSRARAAGLQEGTHYITRNSGPAGVTFLWLPGPTRAALEDHGFLQPRPNTRYQFERLMCYLMENRWRHSDSMTVDCIALARAILDCPLQRIQNQELMNVLDVVGRTGVSQKLWRMRRAGLLNYEKGTPMYPGYQFLRIGPINL